MTHTRYALYHLPQGTALAAFGAAWLGWDAVAGAAVAQLDIAGLRAVTEAPRRYGFHATLKPPFRLAAGADLPELRHAVAELAATTAPAHGGGLALTPLGRFLALTLSGESGAVDAVASTAVRMLDRFRAPPTEEELARRNRARLSPRQAAHLARWGYPHVLEDFRFHLTLTGRLPRAELAHWQTLIARRLPDLSARFELAHVSLMGERRDGFFEEIARFDLTG